MSLESVEGLGERIVWRVLKATRGRFGGVEYEGATHEWAPIE